MDHRQNETYGKSSSNSSGPMSPDLLFEQLAADVKAPIMAGKIAIVVAHPDDESVGIGGQLSRLRDVKMVFVTDGSPKNPAFAEAAGYSDRGEYARARDRELRQALSLSGVPPKNCLKLAIVDQEASHGLVPLTLNLISYFRRIDCEIVLTHPYEGGHPDHDATAFAVHAACRLMAQDCGAGPHIVEMASYHSTDGEEVVQHFIPDEGNPEISIVLNERERKLKRQMLESHASQISNLDVFYCDVERFRRAPAYDFCGPANRGSIHYEKFDWGIKPERWLENARSALQVLGLSGDLEIAETMAALR